MKIPDLAVFSPPGERSCLSFHLLCNNDSRMKNVRQKPLQNLSTRKEITQFTRGKQTTFILLSLLCILETVCQKTKQLW